MRTAIKKLRDTLRPIYGRGETEAMIRLIFHSLKGWSATDLVIHEADTLSDYMRTKIDGIILRLMNCEPIQYILSEAYFYGMNLSVGPGVLIPRPETEELVDMIVKENGQRSDLRVLDIATGSGCIAIALSRFLPFSKVTAIDISAQALSYARENASRLKAGIDFVQSDIFAWNGSRQDFDIIVSNPPYITESEKNDMEPNVLDFEPSEALFVPDSDPLLFYRRIAQTAQTSLCRGGRLYFEINPLFATEIAGMLEGMGFAQVKVNEDIHRRQRFISCLWP